MKMFKLLKRPRKGSLVITVSKEVFVTIVSIPRIKGSRGTYNLGPRPPLAPFECTDRSDDDNVGQQDVDPRPGHRKCHPLLPKRGAPCASGAAAHPWTTGRMPSQPSPSVPISPPKAAETACRQIFCKWGQYRRERAANRLDRHVTYARFLCHAVHTVLLCTAVRRQLITVLFLSANVKTSRTSCCMNYRWHFASPIKTSR